MGALPTGIPLGPLDAKVGRCGFFSASSVLVGRVSILPLAQVATVACVSALIYHQVRAVLHLLLRV